jgi:two-component system sensor histidine kinase PilS (NtrC family)
MMAIISDRERNFPHYLLARLLFVGVILGLALAFLVESSQDRWFLLALFVGNLFLLGLAWVWLKLHGAMTALWWLILSAGVLLDTAVISYTGGVVSEFIFLYFFSIGAASLFLGVVGSVWIALLSEMGYAFVLWGQGGGSFETVAFALFLHAVYFALTAVLTGYLAERLQAKNQALEKARSELSQTRLDTETILRSLSTGLLVTTANGEILYFNSAGQRILGLGCPSEPTLKDSESVGTIRRFFEKMESAQTGRRGEMEFALPNGLVRPIGFSLSSLCDEAGRERGTVVLFSDLTMEKQAEREKWQRERLAAVGELAKDLAHEIRNPLAALSGCVELLVGDHVGVSERERLGDLANRESQRLNHLLRDFSTFARLETPRKRTVNLSQMLRDRSEEFLPLDIRLPADLPIEADEGQLEIVVNALLMALALWAEDGDRVEISSSKRDDRRISIGFRLPGKELPKEVLDSVFRPFGEVWKQRLGLALPTAHRVVAGHGGELRFHSVSPEGTGFELILDSGERTQDRKEMANLGT